MRFWQEHEGSPIENLTAKQLHNLRRVCEFVVMQAVSILKLIQINGRGAQFGKRGRVGTSDADDAVGDQVRCCQRLVICGYQNEECSVAAPKGAICRLNTSGLISGEARIMLPRRSVES